jgi:hypothetical protein
MCLRVPSKYALDIALSVSLFLVRNYSATVF